MKFSITTLLIAMALNLSVAQAGVSAPNDNLNVQRIRQQMTEMGFSLGMTTDLINFGAQACISRLESYDVRAGIYLVIRHHINNSTYDTITIDALEEEEGIQFVIDLPSRHVNSNCRVQLYANGDYNVDYIRK